MHPIDRIKVLIEHEDPIVAAGLAAALSRCPDLEITQRDSELAPMAHVQAAGARERQLDILLTDYRRGCGVAAEAHRPGTASLRGTKVMIVTSLDREWEVRRAVEVGIHGYLLNGCRLDELVDAVRTVGRGARYLCQSVAHRIADSMTRETLTGRETEVLHLIAEGRCNKSIAARLEISVGTVKAHVKAILEKLDAASRTQAAAVAAQRGLVAHRRTDLRLAA